MVESTANQINQYGGYTGLTPSAFRDYVYKIAEKVHFPKDQVILGGDHLGPLIWKDENAAEAMPKAEELVREYAKAGFSKIHLDTSMKLGDDGKGRLSSEVIAERGAQLCSAAEKAFEESGGQRPVYVIGSEVPIPGGEQESSDMKVTSADDLFETIALFNKSFLKKGLKKAWDNVIAVVVQPGVEFGSDIVHDYNRKDASLLKQAIQKYPSIVFEGHSTDYQRQCSLKQMVEDNIAILKVGPELTFALREGILSLSIIENELLKGYSKRSRFGEVLDWAMISSPKNWSNYYKGTELEKALERKYSYSDRCRYYLNDPDVKKAFAVLIQNMQSVTIPMPLISQYFPTQYWKIRDGTMEADPLELVKGNIRNTLDKYYSAVSCSSDNSANSISA